jgi:hypothetical protein
VLGGHIDQCVRCGYEHPSYNSCRNRHCPKCQALVQEQWIEARRARMLDVRHFHVVFTLPAELRPPAAFAPRALFAALFHAAERTLLEMAQQRFQATLGATIVLHTWTRELVFHPHVHAIVTGGGLSSDAASWRPASRRFLFPVKAMGRVFRGKMLHALHQAYRARAFRGFDAFDDPEGFTRLMQRAAKPSWNVYAKPPFAKGKHVLAYLGRYTHRVGIANSRLLHLSDNAVLFRTKGDATKTLSPVEFLRRLVQHVLPDRLHKIRHIGLYAESTGPRRDGPRVPRSQVALARDDDPMASASRSSDRTRRCGVSSMWRTPRLRTAPSLARSAVRGSLMHPIRPRWGNPTHRYSARASSRASTACSAFHSPDHSDWAQSTTLEAPARTRSTWRSLIKAPY